jgi:5-(carboxyamino)imidazole ribonucleotide synthase
MGLAQDKRRQRAELGALGLPVPSWCVVDQVDDAVAFGERHGWPIVLKASRGGYDCRGVWVLRASEDARQIVQEALDAGTVLLAEQFLPLDLEFAVLLARTPDGMIAVYPPIETVQENGICRELRVPADLTQAQWEQAVTSSRRIAEQADMVGIMAIEYFVSNGALIVNELAPRPHNSGHWSIEGATTSQFEQHLRAVAGLPLGDAGLAAPYISTFNILGSQDGSDPRERLCDALAVPGSHVHFYGKVSRPGRKVGHVTVAADSRDAARGAAFQAWQILEGATEDRS